MKAILFDLDGVITDTAEYHYLAWKALADDIGITIDREFNEQLKGIPRMESLEKILVQGGKQDAFTDEEKDALAAKKNDHYQTLIESITPADLLPGIPQLLEDIGNSNLKAVICSSSKNAPVILERLEVADKFDAIVDPATLANSKPAPDIYVEGAMMAGVSLQECVGVEDAASGVDAIKAATMVAVAVGDAETLAKADLVVPSTADLTLDLIRQTWERAHA